MPGKISFSSRRAKPNPPQQFGINVVLGKVVLGGDLRDTGILLGDLSEASDTFVLTDDTGKWLLHNDNLLYGEDL